MSFAILRLVANVIGNNLFPQQTINCHIDIESNSIKETNKRTDGRTKRRVSLSVRPFVRLSVSVVSVRSVHPVEERTAMLHRNLRRG